MQMMKFYSPVFRLLPEDELFYDAESLDAGGPDFGALLIFCFLCAFVLAGIIIGRKEWRRNRLRNSRKDYYRDYDRNGR